MHLYQKLASFQNHKSGFYQNEEFKFFNKHNHLLEEVKSLRVYASAQDDIGIIRANILIKSLMNKSEIEESVAYAFNKSLEIYGKRNYDYIKNFVLERVSDLPYYLENNQKIYVPIFGRVLNLIYSEEYDKLLVMPYNSIIQDFDDSIIDTFDTYGPNLYDSFFSKLVKIKEFDGIVAMYHYDFQSIYFINEQGRLDAKIALFDRFMKKIDNHHMLDRISSVVDAYFENDKDKMIKALIDNKLISNKCISKIEKSEQKFNRKINKKIDKISK